MTADQQDIKNPSLRCNLDPAKAKDRKSPSFPEKGVKLTSQSPSS